MGSTTCARYRRGVEGGMNLIKNLISLARATVLLFPLALFAQESATIPQRTASIYDVVVRVDAVTQRVDPGAPWTIPTIQETRGTGFLVAGNRILTDLELVRGATSITVGLANNPARFPARLQFQAFDAGIAILTVEGTFFQQARGFLPLTQVLPGIGTQISVYGFEEAGALGVRQLQPITFRPDLIAHSDVDRHPLLFLNEVNGQGLTGYAGAPALQGGRLVGLFHTGGGRDYVIPNSVIEHVLNDTRDGRYDGFPLATFSYSPALNLDQRKYLGLDRSIGGVIINRVAFQAAMDDALQPGDVVYEINVNPDDPRQWFPVNAGGLVIHGLAPTERTEIQEYLRRYQAGRIKVRALRGGKKIERGLLLSNNSLFDLRRRRTFVDRKYFLAGGLVFQELDHEIIHEIKKIPARALERLRYRYFYFQRDLLSEQTDREIVLTGVLDDPINSGSRPYVYGIVEAINGRRVRTLRDFAREWELNQNRYVSVKFLDDPVPLTLEAEVLNDADRRVASKFSTQEAGRVR